jgi:protein-S-isoprenylcysteine O-methyltransferase Ste14
MYAVTLVLFLSMPLVLGSGLAFVVFLAYPAIIAKRIRNEEEVLARDLPGYTEYLKKVRWRLIPFVW